MKSTRLPGKVMKLLAGKSVFAHHVERLQCVKGLSEIYLATSSEHEINKQLIDEAENLGIPVYEGANEDVLERHEKIIELTRADAVIRITCDMPLLDITTIEQYIEAFSEFRPDYIYPGNFNLLSGTMCELFSAFAIKESHKHHRGPAIAKYIVENQSEFTLHPIDIRHDVCRSDVRLDLDYPEDFELMEVIYNNLYKGQPIALEEAYRFLDDNPSYILINQWRNHNEVISYVHNRLYKPLYQVSRSGDGYVILDEKAQPIELESFLEKVKELFER
jgi:spore coat polysaccharide biosynthesis protein SpsF